LYGSLERGLDYSDGIFKGCRNLKHVYLIEGELHESITALQLQEWRNDINDEIDSINQILPLHMLAGGTVSIF